MQNRTSITDGHDRLTLQYDEGHFRALIWSSEHGREWRCRAVITQADFQRGATQRRWVADLHGFDRTTGRAIIKVGEMDKPCRGFNWCTYSWREWDLLANSELRVLRVCEDPFEEWEGPKERHKAIVKTDEESVIIDCNIEDWDGALYTSAGNGCRVELRNLHASYEQFMKELAEHYSMEFVGLFAENRGEFRTPPESCHD
jgi:hypothetical protein